MTASSNQVHETYTPKSSRTQLAAVFPDRAQARLVINDLRAFGLRLDQIGVAMRNSDQQARLVVDTGLHASAGALAPAVAAQQGALRNLLAGLRSKLLPNRLSLAPAPASAQRPLLPGGIIGVLMHMRMSEEGARRQEASYRAGSVLVTASVYGEVAEAQAILQRHGGSLVHWGEHVPVI
jgi:hypothetical protein